MTRAKAISKAFSEVSGEPVEFFMNLIELAKQRPGGHKFDEQLTDEEAEKILTVARNDQAGVWNWLLQGFISSMKDSGSC